MRMSLETAAAISGVRPGASAARVSVVASSERSQSRNSPTVRWCDGGEGGGVVGVEDEAGDFVGLVGDDGFVEEGAEREVGEGHLGDDAFFGGGGGNAGEFVAGAEGDALASNVRRSGKECFRPRTVWL